MLAPLEPADACGAGVPVAEPLRARLGEATLAEGKALSSAQIAYSSGVLFVAGAAASLHLALLLLLRDALGSEHARRYEAYSGTLHPPLIPGLTAALASATPADAGNSAARPRLLLPAAAAPPITTATVWTGRDHLQLAALATKGAAQGASPSVQPTQGSQLLHMKYPAGGLEAGFLASLNGQAKPPKAIFVGISKAAQAAAWGCLAVDACRPTTENVWSKEKPQ